MATPTLRLAQDRDADELLSRDPPALHRYPAAMASRIQVLCAYLVRDYQGATAEGT